MDWSRVPQKITVPPLPPLPVVKQSTTPLLPVIPTPSLPVVTAPKYTAIPVIPTPSLSTVRLPTVPTVAPIQIPTVPTVPVIQPTPAPQVFTTAATFVPVRVSPQRPIVYGGPAIPNLSVTKASPDFYEGDIAKDMYTLFKGLSPFFKKNKWGAPFKGMLAILPGLVKQSIATGEPIWKIILRELNASGNNTFTPASLIRLCSNFHLWSGGSLYGTNPDMIAPFAPSYVVQAIAYLVLITAEETLQRGVYYGPNVGNVYISTAFDPYLGTDAETMTVALNEFRYMKVHSHQGVTLLNVDIEGWEAKETGFIGKLPIEKAIQPPSINFQAFAPQLELFNNQAAKLDLPCYMYTLKILNQLRGHFLDGTINVPSKGKSYAVSRAVFSSFSSYFAAAFVKRERQGRTDIEFHLPDVEFRLSYDAYLVEYIKYLDGDAHTLLDVSDFLSNFKFATYIQDRLLAMNQLLAFFDNIEELEFTEEQAAQIQVDITTFLKSLPK